MEDIIRRYAVLSVSRGCGFGGLAIFTVMVGCAADLSLFFRAGGITTLMMCFILLIKAARVDEDPVKGTEVWIMLPENLRPPALIAKPMIARARRDIMMKFAYASAIIAGIELGADLILTLGRLA